MAFCLRGMTVTVCASAKVLVDTRSRPHLFVTDFWKCNAQYQQRCLISKSQYLLSHQPPKKPAGAFLKFMNQKAHGIINKCPDASHLERCRIAGQLWQELDIEEKKRLKLDAEKELKIYHQNYVTFLDQLNNHEKSQFFQEKKDKRAMRAFRRKKMELRRFGRPKKPPNCFNMFVKASRVQQDHAEPPEFLKGLVESWKQMSEEEKAIYRVKASVEKEKYQQEMTKWEQKMKEIGREDLIRKKSQQMLTSLSTKTVTAKKSARPPLLETSIQKTSTKMKQDVEKKTL